MKLAFVLHAYALWLGCCVLSSTAHALALRLAQVRVYACQLFAGRAVASVTLGRVAFALGWVPAGTSVRFDVPMFWLRPVWMRVGVMLIGPAALLPCAAAVLGPQAAWHHFGTGFVQMPLGALHPLSTAQELIARLHGAYLPSLPSAAAILATKLAALECLPLGGMATAQILLEVVGHGGRDDQIKGARFLTLNVLVLVALMAGWAVAAAAYALSAKS